MKFDILQEDNSIIKVIGIGGGGGNAINHMFRQGIKGVDFIICNTDAQALELSPISNKIQLGPNLTEGRGAGSLPEVGRHAAIENIDQIKALLANTKMVFITAGMGGGTGTGASPIIAKAAKEMGILTVGIVTTPFSFEGKRRRSQAEEGLEELRNNVDTLLVVSNDKLRDMFGNLTLTNAFAEADNILTTAAKGIAEIITLPGYINVDFEDVKTVMKNSGAAVMGSYTASGEDRARKAVQGALSSPLLNDNEIEGARYILLNISSGKNEVLMDEVTIITDFIQEEAGLSADIIWGNCRDESWEDQLSVTIIATGFQTKKEKEHIRAHNPEKIIKHLHGLETSLENRELPSSGDSIRLKGQEPKPVIYSHLNSDFNANSNSNPKKEDPFSWNFEPFLKKTQSEKYDVPPGSTPSMPILKVWDASSTPAPTDFKIPTVFAFQELPKSCPEASVPEIKPVGENFVPEIKYFTEAFVPELKQVDAAFVPELKQVDAAFVPELKRVDAVFVPELKQVEVAFVPELKQVTAAFVPELKEEIEIISVTNTEFVKPVEMNSWVTNLNEISKPNNTFELDSKGMNSFKPLFFEANHPGPKKESNEPNFLKQTSLFDFGPASEPKKDLQYSFKNQIKEPRKESVAEIPQLEDPMKRTKDRIMRLKELSMKLKSPKGLEDLENEPAYVRKNLKLDQLPHSSSAEEMSRLTLSDRDGITEIRSNNTFLHDNVD